MTTSKNFLACEFCVFRSQWQLLLCWSDFTFYTIFDCCALHIHCNTSKQAQHRWPSFPQYSTWSLSFACTERWLNTACDHWVLYSIWSLSFACTEKRSYTVCDHWVLPAQRGDCTQHVIIEFCLYREVIIHSMWSLSFACTEVIIHSMWTVSLPALRGDYCLYTACGHWAMRTLSLPAQRSDYSL